MGFQIIVGETIKMLKVPVRMSSLRFYHYIQSRLWLAGGFHTILLNFPLLP